MIPIDPNESFFLAVLADHLNGRMTSEPCGDTDWPALITLAQNHEVRGILYHQCRAFVPEPYSSRLAQMYSMELFSYQNRLTLFSQLSDALRDAGIPFFTVKGLDVARLYPYPALRTMGDCDVAVHEEDKERAQEVFLRLGYEKIEREEYEWTYVKNGLEFELHHGLLYDEPGNTDESRAFCEKAWDYVKEDNGRYVLDWSFHYIFLLLHLHKHLIHSGAGFRQLMDLYVAARGAVIDREWVNAELRMLGLLEFSKRCTELTERCFAGGELTEPDRRCLAQVVHNGAFGFQDEANAGNLRVDEMMRGKGPRWLRRILRLLRSAFPGYDTMRSVEPYKALDGRPWLLPVFWVYRWYRAVRYRMADDGKRVVNNAVVPDEEIAAREEKLRSWGL